MKLVNRIPIPCNKVQPHCNPVGWITYNDETEEYTLYFYTDSGTHDIESFLVHTHTFKNPFIDLDYDWIDIPPSGHLLDLDEILESLDK